MKTINRIRTVALLGLALSASACEEGLTEINENPNNPENVPVQSLLQNGLWAMVQPSNDYGVFGTWTTLFHANLWAQHVAQSTYNDEDHYAPREGIPKNIWQSLYAGSLQDLRQVKALADEAGDQNLAAIAEVMQVYGFLFLTDFYGDVPYAEALDLAKFPTPKFQAQSEIYPALLTRLGAAAGRIQPTGSSVGWADGDVIYNGDLDRWQEFANSLRLRIAMRIADTPAGAQARTEFAAAWAANRFDGPDDNADLDWTGTDPLLNPYYEKIIKEGRTGDFRVSKSMVDALQSRNDPRLPLFASPAASSGQFRGLQNGYLPQEVPGGSTLADYSTIGPAFLGTASPSVLMSHAEMLFLGAEAAQRGWITASAATLYQDAIRSSMRQFGVSDAAITTYLGQPSAAYAGLNSVYLQKWIATFLQGPEAFAEVRRTGQPSMPLAYKAVITSYPQRMIYPPDEGLYNPNFETVKNVTITQPMFWSKR
jgi:hypothetical protein